MANSFVTRRTAATVLAMAALVPALPKGAFALDVNQARTLVDGAVAAVNATIDSGKSEAAMLRDFEAIFARYADVRYIAQSALGPAGRSASPAAMDAYVKAFQGYIAHKYGRRFREFIGGQIEVTGARPLKSFFEVTSTARLKGQAPFQVAWHVFDKSGKNLFFNIIIEGVNMLAAERTEIGAMLDRRKGDISALTADLRALG
ncbi:MAG: ABC transporter substrate-binding protein [Rhodobacteraceae bacterium]|nr:ABC transporter substrate-binding protein [Paracoccaceae bacterium]